MIKYIIILMNLLALIVVRVFFAGDVSVKITAPEKVKQGEEITVNVTVNKGSISGVGFFKEELPAGFGEGTPIEVKGSEFKYLQQDNVVKCTWISLPADGEFTISYKLKVSDAAVNGKVSLGGKFSYVLDNQKQTFEIPAFIIQVGEEVLATTTTPSETKATEISQPEIPTTQPQTTETTTIEPETTTSTQAETTVAAEKTSSEIPATTAAATTIPETTATANPVQTTTGTEDKIISTVSATRTIVGSPEAGTEFTVEINVKKSGVKGFARVQETLPLGLTAIALDNKGGTFSFLDQKMKIIWDNLPADENIKVSYRVAVSDNVAGDLTITGAFSYVDNNDPKKEVIPATDISVKAKTTLAANNATENTTTTNVTTQSNQDNTQPPQDNTTTSNVQNTTANNTTATIPTPEKNVSYKVQICALSKMQRGTAYFESKYNIGDKVSMELHEGWRKYIVGKYTKYQEARDYRENIRSKGVENPFVTAYNSGKRVTVQEALMVSSQQWVR